VWLKAAHLEEERNQAPLKARALLDRARTAQPKHADLWMESARLELRHHNEAFAKKLLAKALQQCPLSGPLWVEAIFIEPAAQQKSKLQDAIRTFSAKGSAYDKDLAMVHVAAGRLFWLERNLEKAKINFETALKLAPGLPEGLEWHSKFIAENPSLL